MTNNKLKPNQNLLRNLLSLYQNKDYTNAENLALSISKKHPNHKYAWKILAGVFEQTNRILDSIKANQKALEIDPDDHEIYFCLGNNFHKYGKFDDAEHNYKKAINLKPNYLHALNSLALILKQMHRLEESKSCYKRIISLKPDFAKAYNNLSVILIELGDLDEAIVNLKKAIGLKPDYPQAFFNLGLALRNSGLKEKATDEFKNAIALKPDYKIAYNFLGANLLDLGKNEEALESFQEVINLDPFYAAGYNNLGNTFLRMRSIESALQNYKKAIDLKPDYAEAYNNWGRALMLNFDFHKAFELMEWRLQLEEKHFIPLNTSKPRWDGLTKHRVFLWKEQGIGDHIMFSSMISELHASVEKVIVECDPRLLPLFQRSFSDEIQFITDRSEISENDYDSHLPIGSLPFHFRKELDDFKKSSQGWLQADPEKVQSIKEKILQSNPKKIIGVSWKTLSLLSSARLRNIDLESLLKPFKELDIKFINLQYGDVSEEITNLKVNHGIDVLEIPDLDVFNDIDGLAATIAACNLVISIDNLIPHFAGALGVNTKLLLPYNGDERWGYKTNTSYWYNCINIYRQTVSGNWTQPLSMLADDLINYK